METKFKSAKTAAKIANVLRILSIVGLVAAILMAIGSFAMAGYINQYYQDPANVAAASGSLEADMGVFGFLPFDTLREAGNYGVFFGLQSICWGLIMALNVFLYTILKKIMVNIRETGAAFAPADAASYKRNFTILTILVLIVIGLSAGIIAGILLCGLYNVTLSKYQEK